MPYSMTESGDQYGHRDNQGVKHLTWQGALPEGFDLSRIHPDDRERMFVDFYRVLNGLRTTQNVDVYVTGSNSRLLASDVATEFRGRGHVIQVAPLSFAAEEMLLTKKQ